MTHALAMDVGQFQTGVYQSIKQLRDYLETHPEALEAVDVEDLKQDTILLSDLIGFVSIERMLDVHGAERRAA